MTLSMFKWSTICADMPNLGYYHDVWIRGVNAFDNNLHNCGFRLLRVSVDVTDSIVQFTRNNRHVFSNMRVKR